MSVTTTIQRTTFARVQKVLNAQLHIPEETITPRPHSNTT